MKQFLITDYGAVSGRETLQTEKIQACIEACREAGGGEVLIPAGTFLIGSLRLYSNMTLHLQSGAVLLGSKDYRDYTDFHVPTTIKYLYDEYYIKAWNLPSYYFYGLITAFQAENVQVIGEQGSVIDGQDTFDVNGEEKFRGPMGIIMSQVRNLHLEGYTFQNSANWSHTLDGCQELAIENVTIKAGHDGFNLHHSSDIQVKDCRLESGDDCFAGYDIKNLHVSNCYLNTACNALRIGGEKLIFEGCIFEGPGHYPHISEGTHYTHGIFKYYSMDADAIDNPATGIVLKDCSMKDVEKLLVYDNGNKSFMQDNQPLKDVTLENVRIIGLAKTSVFKGNGSPVTLKLRNVQIDCFKEFEFLEIDASVALDFERVCFSQPTTILVEGGERLVFSGETDFRLDRKK